MDPVLVVGMHRSGTSLLARLLAEMGLCLGPDLTPLYESRFFRRLNQEILGRAGASWTRPRRARRFLDEDGARNACIAWIRQRLGRGRGRAFLRSTAGPWAFKDPRTTILLPVWLEVFPQARVLHIVRNGVDVSRSVVARERSRDRAPDRFAPRIRTALRHLRARLGYGLRPTPRGPEDHDAAFALWDDYLSLALEALKGLPQGRWKTLRYEDLLADPVAVLAGVRRFTGAPSDASLESLARGVDRGRALRFRAEPELLRLYRDRRHHPMMRLFGYSTLIPEAAAPGDAATAPDPPSWPGRESITTARTP